MHNQIFCQIIKILNGDWGLGPIPNPQSPFQIITKINKYIIIKKIKYIFFNIYI